MKFVIMHMGEIPGYGHVRGPVLTPQSYNLNEVLKWISHGVDIREVMDDGSYREMKFNDRRLKEAIDRGGFKVANEEPKLVDINIILNKKENDVNESEIEEDEDIIEEKELSDKDVKEYPNADVFEGLDREGFVIDNLEESE